MIVTATFYPCQKFFVSLESEPLAKVRRKRLIRNRLEKDREKRDPLAKHARGAKVRGLKK